ncbi:hypothetical protein ACOSQ2_010588 [Xanthoceras sorbifolium]
MIQSLVMKSHLQPLTQLKEKFILENQVNPTPTRETNRETSSDHSKARAPPPRKKLSPPQGPSLKEYCEQVIGSKAHSFQDLRKFNHFKQTLTRNSRPLDRHQGFNFFKYKINTKVSTKIIAVGLRKYHFTLPSLH